MPAPRVAFLARNLAVGGAERAVVNLANHVQRVEPHLVLLRRRGGLLGDVAPHVALHALDAPALGGRLSADRLEATPFGSTAQLALEVERLAAVVDATQCAVVSSFLMRSHLVALLVKALLRPELRVVLNIHEQMTESAEYLYPRLHDRWAMRRITRHLFRRADRIVVVAEELRRDLVENFGLPAPLIRTVHNPVDLERIRELAAVALPADFRDEREISTICAIGRLVPLKGYDLLLRAVAELRSRLRVRLVLVGDGEIRGELERMVHALGLTGAVHFTGWEGNPWRWVARADVLALSSRTEAFPSVITEAHALGVPVVAAECSAGVRESVQGGKAGVLVAPGSSAALAEGLERVLVQPRLREALRREGEAFVARFALPRAVAAYEEVMLDVLRHPEESWVSGAIPVPADASARSTA